MASRNEEYLDAHDVYEESQLDMFVRELLIQLSAMKGCMSETDSAVVLLNWVEEKVLRLQHDLKE